MNDLITRLKERYMELLIAGVFSMAVYFVRTIYISVKENTTITIQHDKKIDALQTSDEIKTNTDVEILKQLKELNSQVTSNKIDIEVLKSKHDK